MEKPVIRISVRNLVEFILRSGDLTSRSGTAADKEAMLKAAAFTERSRNRWAAPIRQKFRSKKKVNMKI